MADTENEDEGSTEKKNDDESASIELADAEEEAPDKLMVG